MINHYGKWVDPDVAITGVHSINDVMWEFIDNGICLDCEEAEKQAEKEYSAWREENPDYTDDDEYSDAVDGRQGWISNDAECDSSHTQLIGDWIINSDGEYEYDPSGEFAAIVRETVVQVIFSKYTERHALCSPCYPGQADVGSVGEFLCYVLPPEIRYKD